MDTAIKEYKELTKIELYNGESIYTEENIENIYKSLNQDNKFFKFGDRIINKSNIKEAYKFQCGGIEGYILSFNKDLQRIIRQRDEEKRNKIGKGFESIEEISNYLKNKNYI